MRGGDNLVKIGDSVTYVDEKGVKHNALITCVFASGHSAEDDIPSINVVHVSPNPLEDDPYGRQIVRETSIVHKDNQAAHGNYWQ